MTHAVDRYDELHAGFRWQVPARFNIAEVCCARWAREHARAIAIRHELDSGSTASPHMLFAELHRAPNRLANVLRGLACGGGDRVASWSCRSRSRPAVATMRVYTDRRGWRCRCPMLFGPRRRVEFRINDRPGSESGDRVDETASKPGWRPRRLPGPAT
jgi:acetyl-CoA synthetase